MGDATLLVANSIKVLTQNGECQIDLCLGDITKLKKKDKVDVICVSAFRGDYAATPTSVIGALKRSLNLSVFNLAKDKEEDLRNLYSCWWSKQLPSNLPYRRLLCFETGRSTAGRPQELVANVFRCLVPILNNEDGSVITPLLNTGDQGYGEISMLQGMVEAAVNWMKAGLPLRLMKLVLYARVVDGDLQGHTLRRFSGVMNKFNELKERYEMQLLLPKAVPLEFDVYISFSKEDEEVAKVIREKLCSAKNSVRIYDSSKQELDKDQVFQQDMYTVMMKSARVLTVLSPNYLKDNACIEQYNIALCCNRRAHRDMLAPFYVDSVELMPTYMGLVQYVDCRPHDPSKIDEACSQLTISLSVTLHTELRIAEFDPLRYDVFLSYSHRDTEKANRFVSMLQKLAPDLKLFFDVQELKTGKSWQRTLYHSIDGSRCMLALISAPYLKSAVCQEEFSLAQAKHYAKGKQHLQLIPICLEELTSIQPEFTHIPMVKGTPDVFEDMVKTICPAVVQWLKGEKVTTTKTLATLFKDEDITSISPSTEMEAFRQAEFEKEFGMPDILAKRDSHFPPNLSKVLLDPEKGVELPDARPKSAHSDDCDVVFSYHSDDHKYANFMAKVLALKAPSLRVKTVASNEHEKLNLLERADCIVPILSPNYLESVECVEEFHIALWRQRIANPDAPMLMPVRVHPLLQKPTYFHLVRCPADTADSVWASLTGRFYMGLPSDIDNLNMGAMGLQLGPADALALLLAVYRILQRFATARLSKVQEYPPKPALFNMMKVREETKQMTQEGPVAEVSQVLMDLHLGDIPDSWRKEGQYIHPDAAEKGDQSVMEKGNQSVLDSGDGQMKVQAETLHKDTGRNSTPPQSSGDTHQVIAEKGVESVTEKGDQSALDSEDGQMKVQSETLHKDTGRNSTPPQSSGDTHQVIAEKGVESVMEKGGQSVPKSGESKPTSTQSNGDTQKHTAEKRVDSVMEQGEGDQCVPKSGQSTPTTTLPHINRDSQPTEHSTTKDGEKERIPDSRTEGEASSREESGNGEDYSGNPPTKFCVTL